MKKKTSQPVLVTNVSAGIGVVKVTVDPKKIVDLFTTTQSNPTKRFSDAAFDLLNDVPGIAQPAPNGPLKVTQAMPIVFVFDDSQLSNIRPIGIVFHYEGNVLLPNPDGDANFPYREVRFVDGGEYKSLGAGIRVWDTYVTAPKRGSNQKVLWSFYILFQTADGRLGMIDPALENES